MKYCRQQFARYFVHVGDHQQKSLGRGVCSRQRTGGKRSVYGTRRTGFGLHFNDLHFLPENIPLSMGRPFIYILRHWGRRGNGINGGYFGKGIGHICRCLVTIHGFYILSHLYSSSCKLFTFLQFIPPLTALKWENSCCFWLKIQPYRNPPAFNRRILSVLTG